MKAQQLAVQPEDTQKVLREVAERSARIIGEFAQRHVANSISAAVTDELGIAKAYMDLYAGMLAKSGTSMLMLLRSSRAVERP